MLKFLVPPSKKSITNRFKANRIQPQITQLADPSKKKPTIRFQSYSIKRVGKNLIK